MESYKISNNINNNSDYKQIKSIEREKTNKTKKRPCLITYRMIQMSRNDRCNVFYASRRFLVSPLASVVPFVWLASFVYSCFDVGIVFACFFVATRLKIHTFMIYSYTQIHCYLGNKNCV